MPDIAIGKGYLVNKFLEAGAQSPEKSVNVREFLNGSTPAGASRAGAVNFGVDIPADLHMTPRMAELLDSKIDQGYKIMGQRDMATRLSRLLGGE